MLKVFIANRSKEDLIYEEVFNTINVSQSIREYEKDGYYVIELPNVNESKLNELKYIRGLIVTQS